MRNKIIFLVLGIIIMKSHILWAYDGGVHYKINEQASNASHIDTILLTNLNIPRGMKAELTKGKLTKQIIEWLAYGGEAEDFNFGIFGLFPDATITYASTRAFNHFHDPLKTWDEAEYDDLFRSLYIANYHRPPVSSILWGLNPGQQDFSANETGDWSWGKARELFYIYLTGHDFFGNTVDSSKEGEHGIWKIKKY